MIFRLLPLLVILLLQACASGPSPSPMGEESGQGRYKVGKPYDIDGITYYPAEDYSYDETGIASWYGPGFHGRYTANGEVYDSSQLTAAHRTLPMPSLVRVTNLDNGKSIVVRINDRGPFAKSRILDMSDRGAELLGYKGKGTAKVRVQILSEESRAIAEAAKAKGTYDPGSLPPATQLASKAGVELDTTDSSPVAATSIAVERESLAPINVPEKPPVIAAAPQAMGSAMPTPQPVQPLAKPALQQLETKEAANRYLPEQKVEQRPAVPGTKIYVQAGAFSVAENAQKLSQTLSQYGPTSISQASVEGRTFHRVRIGPFKSVQEADAALNKVMGSGEKSARVVVDR